MTPDFQQNMVLVKKNQKIIGPFLISQQQKLVPRQFKIENFLVFTCSKFAIKVLHSLNCTNVLAKFGTEDAADDLMQFRKCRNQLVGFIHLLSTFLIKLFQLRHFLIPAFIKIMENVSFKDLCDCKDILTLKCSAVAQHRGIK